MGERESHQVAKESGRDIAGRSTKRQGDALLRFLGAAIYEHTRKPGSAEHPPAMEKSSRADETADSATTTDEPE